MELKIGADPELWIKDNKTDKIISADGLFPGTKENPYPVAHGAIQVDGMAAEYNILPASTKGEFTLHNLSVLRDLRNEIKKNNPDLDFSFVFNPVAEFGKKYIKEQREEARRLGCTPDYNAYENGAENPTPDADMPFRTASGHIHVGWGDDFDIKDPEHIEACCMMVKQLDCLVGTNLPQIEGPEGLKRRKLYGKAGAFRPKKYGVEYRTPSNVWLQHPYYMQKMFDTTSWAFHDLLNGSRYYDVPPYDEARKLIDIGDAYILSYNFGKWDLYNARRPVKGMVTVNNLDELVEEYRQFDKEKRLPHLVPVAPAPWDREDPAPNEGWVLRALPNAALAGEFLAAQQVGDDGRIHIRHQPLNGQAVVLDGLDNDLPDIDPDDFDPDGIGF